MDSQVFPAYNLSNIPLEVDRDRLVRFLTFFIYGAQETDQIDVNQLRLYRRGRNQFAVVFGLPFQFGELKRRLKMTNLLDQQIFVNYDFGFARQISGMAMNQPLATRDLFQNMFMLPHGNLSTLFVNDIATCIPNRMISCRVVMHGVQDIYNFGYIFQVGQVNSFVYKPEEEFLMINYNSLLGKVQALCYLNGNRRFSLNGTFQDCDIDRQTGIWRFGVLDIRDTEEFYGYVPFSVLDEDLIQLPDLSNVFTTCYKCNGHGELELHGVTTCLKFYVARCTVCSYNGRLEDPLENGQAVRYNGEPFTRVRIGRNDFRMMNGLWYALNVVHTPLRFTYSTPWEVRNIIGEVVDNEARTQERLFTYENRAVGNLQNSTQLIEHNREWVYLIGIRIARAAAWRHENFNKFQEVAFEIWSRNPLHAHGQYFKSSHVSNIAYIENIVGGEVLVRCRVAMSSAKYFMEEQQITIYPLTIHREYTTVRVVMTEWANNPQQPRFALLNDLLLGHETQFDLDPEEFPDEPLLWQQLNEHQLNALLRSQSGRLSVVHCPPGTGKNLTAAVTALELARTEQGLILCVTKSNKAADNLCIAIEERKSAFEEHYEGVTVLRMVSRKWQECFFRSLPIIEGTGLPFRSIPEAILTHPLFGREPGLEEIFQKIGNVGMDMLTSMELIVFTQHIHDIELLIIRGTRIIVTTAATLYDGRMNQYLLCPNPSTNDSIYLNTVLMDEGGQFNVPLSLPILAYPAKRYLIFGDPDQLCPIVKSSSAEAAGLCVSIMQFLRHGVARNHPNIWHTLTLQSSMPGRICNLISEMSYNGQLLCSVDIIHRQRSEAVVQLRGLVNAAIPATVRSDMVVVHHSFPQERHERLGGKINAREANIVVRLAHILCNSGVGHERMTIIAPFEDQRQLLVRLLSQSPITSGMQVVTPATFEGKNNDIIIVSMVCSARGKDTGYASSHQRRLTAILSFVRQFVFFVMNRDTYRINTNDESYITVFQRAINEAPKLRLQ